MDPQGKKPSFLCPQMRLEDLFHTLPRCCNPAENFSTRPGFRCFLLGCLPIGSITVPLCGLYLRKVIPNKNYNGACGRAQGAGLGEPQKTRTLRLLGPQNQTLQGLGPSQALPQPGRPYLLQGHQRIPKKGRLCGLEGPGRV